MGATFRDRLGSVLMLVFIAVLWVQRNYTTPFGGVFPDKILILTTLFSVLALVLSFTPYRVMKEEGDETEAISRRQWIDMTVVAAILLLWVLLLRYLGFVLTGAVGFTVVAWYISGERKHWKTIVKALVVGVAMTYLILLIFGHLLQVPLPEGEWLG